jgi:arylsulfatase A
MKSLKLNQPRWVCYLAQHLGGVAVLLCLFLGIAQAADPRPNIVLILADDLGYGDIKSFGGDRCQIATPGFDQLAREGMRFTDAHTVCSWCTPSRLSIMTGRYSWRFQRPKSDGPWAFLNPRLGAQTFTIGHLLQRVGYRTGYFGKWHLGTSMVTTNGQNQGPTNVDYQAPLTFGPNQCGFGESFILPGSLDMFPYAFLKNHRWMGPVNAIKGCSAFGRLGPAAADFEFDQCLDRITTQAEAFIAEVAKSPASPPFFLYLALTGPHTPLSPGQGFAGRSKLGLYGDMVMETDHCVVRVLSLLKAHGLGSNTLVLATSDNGPGAYAGRLAKATRGQLHELEKDGHFAAGPWRGNKATVYDGGTRVPFVVRWPGVVKPGEVCERLVSSLDTARTLAEICNLKLEPDQAPDSLSFLPLLRNPGAPAVRSSLMTESSHAFAVRSDGWKLCLTPGPGTQTETSDLPLDEEVWRRAVAEFGRKPTRQELTFSPFVQLFDLTQDPGESVNRAAKHPEKAQELFGHMKRLIANGRTTPGAPLANDTTLDPWVRMPKFLSEP